ncbi:MAG: hypothetical protein JSV42_03530 [Chloroflexota bacterium]|nr:MAG: hypothetical protein JSV42_03530 [Chloroflexota bacterium]
MKPKFICTPPGKTGKCRRIYISGIDEGLVYLAASGTYSAWCSLGEEFVILI